MQYECKYKYKYETIRLLCRICETAKNGTISLWETLSRRCDRWLDSWPVRGADNPEWVTHRCAGKGWKGPIRDQRLIRPGRSGRWRARGSRSFYAGNGWEPVFFWFKSVSAVALIFMSIFPPKSVWLFRRITLFFGTAEQTLPEGYRPWPLTKPERCRRRCRK